MTIVAHNKYDSLIKDSDTQRVHLVTGKTEIVRTNYLVGYCHWPMHVGYLTKKTLKQKHCIEKKCPHLERFNTAPFWGHHAQRTKEAKEHKNSKRRSKENKRSNDALLQLMHRQAQEYADSIKLGITITSVVPMNGAYIVFYLSDLLFNDSYYYTSVSWKLHNIYPEHKFIMRHIKKDGKYMPISALKGGH